MSSFKVECRGLVEGREMLSWFFLGLILALVLSRSRLHPYIHPYRSGPYRVLACRAVRRFPFCACVVLLVFGKVAGFFGPLPEALPANLPNLISRRRGGLDSSPRDFRLGVVLLCFFWQFVVDRPGVSLRFERKSLAGRRRVFLCDEMSALTPRT